MFPQRLAAVLAFVGSIWFLQGLGVIKGSFMSGSRFWTVAGGACLVAGVAVAIVQRLKRPRL